MSELQGMSILVVGASGGLGSEIAKHLHERGARLTLTGRSQQALDAVGVPGHHVIGDVTKPGVAESFVQGALDAHQALDGVVYAAGAVAFGSIADLTDQVADDLWEVNAKGFMSTLRAALPALTQSGTEGRSPWVVTLSGVVAEAPTAGLAAYSAVKAALHAYGVAAARELRRGGIRLIDARPGHTETALSTHPLAGVAPAFPAGLDPEAVAKRIVDAVVADEKDLPSAAFHGLS